MAFSTVAAFWAVSFLFVITPGADWAYAITAGLRSRGVIPAVAGLVSGHLVATGIVAAGVAVLIARSSILLTALTVAGAAYLVWLGVAMLTNRHDAGVAASDCQADESVWRQAFRGLGISGLNPKVFLLFLALLPQFVDKHASWPVPAQIVTLGLVHVASCTVVYTTVATTARRVLRSRPTAARAVITFSGGAMVIIGSVLVLEQVFV